MSRKISKNSTPDVMPGSRPLILFSMAPMRPVYVRLSEADVEALDREASGDERKRSELIRRAVKIYLSGGAEKFAETMAKQVRTPPPETPAEMQIRRFGEWFVNLPTDIRGTVFLIAEALKSMAGGRPLDQITDIPEDLSRGTPASRSSSRMRQGGEKRKVAGKGRG